MIDQRLIQWRWKTAVFVVPMLFMIAEQADADIVTQFGPSGLNSGNVSNLLNQVGIGSTNSASETTALTFEVPGAPGSNTNLTFTFVANTGAFLYTFGFFDASVPTANPVTEKQLWATQALSSAVQVFDDRVDNPIVSRSFTVAAGTTLGFFLIPNNTLANFQANPGAFYPSQTSDNLLRSPLFSITDANPGELDQMLSFVGNGVTLFTFEDLTRTGSSDQDFVDLAFTIDAELIPSVVPEPTTIVNGLFGIALIMAGWTRFGRRRKPLQDLSAA
ncbi:DUF4114 domain-containing protein [Tautonia rosea]|uniref:DUF4114 domain-containing protein n=1 Tax=Tautonia rosea TaxID=2728037 RepID=UPI0014744AE3|nr:DUF4114 domain-containing protein [Tautonia rosea]